VTTLTVRPPTRSLAALLLAAALAAGCSGGDQGPVADAAPATSGPPQQESTRETTTTECTPVERQGRRLGVTVPAGFSVTSTPQGGGDSAGSQVNLLAVAQRRSSDGELPLVVVVVYGYGPGERSGTDALEASVRNFRQLVGADHPDGPVTARPATVAGRPGSAGGDDDPTAMDFQSPDGRPSPLHWWSVPSDGGQFVVAMGSRDAATDDRFAGAFRKGLKAGGCR
jgi:hypothetical protein